MGKMNSKKGPLADGPRKGANKKLSTVRTLPKPKAGKRGGYGK